MFARFNVRLPTFVSIFQLTPLLYEVTVSISIFKVHSLVVLMAVEVGFEPTVQLSVRLTVW